MDLRTAIEALEKQHGSLLAVSRVTEIDVAYLWRLKYGEKVNPSAATLRRLGLKRAPAVYHRVPKNSNGG